MSGPLTRAFVLSGMVALGTGLGNVEGTAEELLVAVPGQVPTTIAVEANSDFAFDLYKQLAKDNEGQNLFFSPYSVFGAMAVTLEGARRETAAEMGRVLQLPEAARRSGESARQIPWETLSLHAGIAELNRRLTGGKDQYEIRIANALWSEKTYPLHPQYVRTISEHYTTGGVFPVDFRNASESARQKINAWVEQQTNNRIKDLLPTGAVDEQTRLVLTDAVYFKGQWSEPFRENLTENHDFTLANGASVKVPMMRALNVAGYGAFNADGSFFATPMSIPSGQGFDAGQGARGLYPDADGFAMVELPYKGDDLSMVVIVPRHPQGLGKIEQQLTPANLNRWIGRLQQRETHVYLPKFRMETEYTLGDSGQIATLQRMGMVRAFVDPRVPEKGAQFQGMTTSTDPMEQLYLAKVLHKAFVEVNEEGTEAAAATAVAMLCAASAPIDQPFIPEFKADRPFVFLIRDKRSDSVLFLGRMLVPAAD